MPPVPGNEATVASRQNPATGKLMLGPACGSKHRFRRRHLRQFTTVKGVNAIGAFSEDAFARAIGPLFISGLSADILRPILHDVVGAGQILTARRAGDGGESGSGLRLSLDGRQGAGNSDADGHTDRQHQKHQANFFHGIPPKRLSNVNRRPSQNFPFIPA